MAIVDTDASGSIAYVDFGEKFTRDHSGVPTILHSPCGQGGEEVTY